ncbi:MAG: hypothetical protein JW993_15800 [Sedimentisphaerales bacterium]|nr:hypothetical protein [Sedimentisphaerales bacterium]
MRQVKRWKRVTAAMGVLGFTVIAASRADAYEYPFYEQWEIAYDGTKGVCEQDKPIDDGGSFTVLLGLYYEGEQIKSILAGGPDGWEITGSWNVYSGTAPGVVFGLGRYQGDELLEAYQFRGNQTSDNGAEGYYTL